MKYYGLTDTGNVREENQDSFQVKMESDSCTAVLCDGMGGEQAGSTASTLAVDSFMFHASGVADLSSSSADIRRILTEAVSYANLKVYDKAYSNFSFLGMGTTLVGCIITNKHAVIVNVGDSRAYHIRKNSIYQVTKDHSVVSELVSSGEITAEEAKTHPKKNVITRAVGVEASVKADTFEIMLNAGDRLLLCSDGLSNLVNDTELLKASKCDDDIKILAANLIALVKKRGAPDNVSLILIEK